MHKFAVNKPLKLISILWILVINKLQNSAFNFC
jgi:hypothetical protein